MAFNCQRYPKIFSLFLTFSHFFSLFIIFYHFLSFFTTFVFIIYVTKILSKLIPTNLGTNIVSLRGGSERQVPGRFRGRFPTTFRTTGSRKVPGQLVPNHGFRAGSEPRSEPRVPMVPGQVPIHEFRDGSGKGSEPGSDSRVPGKVPNHVPNHGFREGSGAGSDARVPGFPGQVPIHGLRGQNWKKTRTQIFFACIVTQLLSGITPGLIFCIFLLQDVFLKKTQSSNTAPLGQPFEHSLLRQPFQTVF